MARLEAEQDKMNNDQVAADNRQTPGSLNCGEDTYRYLSRFLEMCYQRMALKLLLGLEQN